MSVNRILSIAAIFVCLFSFQQCSKNDPKPTVLTDEGIFINEVYSTGNDWLELYNDNSSSKDIGGYFIYDKASDKYKIPVNTSIAAKSFLVLICDETATGLHTNFKLSSSGETVSLENSSGELIDEVEFPALLDGQSYARIPDGASTFSITGNPTQGATNGGSAAPVIGEVTKFPIIPRKTDAVIVSTPITDVGTLSTVKLFYRLAGGSFSSVAMTLSVNNIYSGTIPATNADGLLEYYIEATNSSSKTSHSPTNAPTSVYSFLINSDAIPKLVVNEFMAANKTCCPDTDGGTEEYDDWFEIYNYGSSTINLAGMYFSDNASNPFKFRVADTNSALTTIQPGGFLVVWADSDQSQGILHTNFKLSSAEGSIGIYYLDGRTVDEYAYGIQVDDVSYGRTTDGALTWKSFSSPTPGTSN